MTEAAIATGTRLRLHRLTMVPDVNGVMVGRPDIASYAVFPPEGAEALRMLDSGASVEAVADWWAQTCDEELDVDDLLEALEELQFIRSDGEEVTELSVRWQRLGRTVFSAPAWLCYLVLLAAGVTAMYRHPGLRPSYRDIFFTHYLSLIPIALMATSIPCILVHESFHALAGRRLGLPSKLSVGRRLYYIVAETNLDALFSVPRRQRFLPFFAGMLADGLLVALFTLLAAELQAQHAPPWLAGLCLLISFSSILRLVWQLLFYLQTDLYFVISHALGCADLQNAARFQIRTQLRRLTRRPAPVSETEWSDRDRLVAKWYAPVFVLGYAFSLGSLAWAGIPTTVRLWSTLVERLWSHTSLESILDAVSFVLLSTLNWGLLGYISLRDRRRARAAQTQDQGA